MVLRGKTRTRFSVQAEYNEGTLPRVLEMFSVRGVDYHNMSAHRTNEGQQWIELDCSDIEDQHTGVLMNKIRQIVTVRTVRVETLILPA